MAERAAGPAERAAAPAPAPAATPAAPSRRPAAAPPAPAPAPTLRLAPEGSASPPAGIPAPVADTLRSPGAGEPLPLGTAHRIGSSFGVDVSPVRVHNDARAADAADLLSARAFTWGSHVFLGSGQHAGDLGLMAHEVTHVVQQQTAPSLQLSSSRAGDAFEREADVASAAVVRGDSVTVAGRVGGPTVQRSWVPGFVRRGIAAVGSAVSAVADIGAAVRDRVLNFVRERARQVPGYDLLAFVLGRDPISQQNVERTPTALVGALLGLIPGGQAIFQNLQQANVIQRAFDWASTELGKLNLTWPVIRGLFAQAWDALSASDFLNPGAAWEKLRAIFGPPLGRLVDFARAAGRKLLELVFEGALALAGGAAQRVLGIFRRVGAVFTLIVNDPVAFLRHLIDAAVGGFRRFGANILQHLRTGLFEWLLGALRGALTLPQRFDLAGIVSVVLQILGLTWTRLRARLVSLIGERAVAFLEGAFDFLQAIVTRGLAAAWEKIVEFASGLFDTVVGGIRDWVARSVVGAAITRLATMFNPVGAIIQAVIGAYNTVMFFIERAQQIAALVESIVDSVDNIARGNISAAIGFVERTLARTIPVMLGFFARLLGLGNIAGQIRTIIQRIQAVVDRALDRVIDFVVTRGRALLARMGGGAAGRPPAAAAQPSAGAAHPGRWAEVPLTLASGERHTVFAQVVEGGAVRIGMASDPQWIEDVIAALAPRIPALPDEGGGASPRARAEARVRRIRERQATDARVLAERARLGQQPNQQDRNRLDAIRDDAADLLDIVHQHGRPDIDPVGRERTSGQTLHVRMTVLHETGGTVLPTGPGGGLLGLHPNVHTPAGSDAEYLENVPGLATPTRGAVPPGGGHWPTGVVTTGAQAQPAPAVGAGPVPREVTVRAWTTGNTPPHGANTSHTENQLYHWLQAQGPNFWRRVTDIEVRSTYSPCSGCTSLLADIKTTMLDLGGKRTPAVLFWDQAYEPKAAALRRRDAPRTTSHDVSALRRAGWIVHGPMPTF